MNVKQYPHYLFVIIGGEATRDDDGNWVGGGEPEARLVSVCREETNGRGNEIRAGDGKFYRFSSLVQMPVKGTEGTFGITEGSTVFVADFSDGTRERVKGKVLKFDKGQLHCRLWVN